MFDKLGRHVCLTSMDAGMFDKHGGLCIWKAMEACTPHKHGNMYVWQAWACIWQVMEAWLFDKPWTRWRPVSLTNARALCLTCCGGLYIWQAMGANSNDYVKHQSLHCKYLTLSCCIWQWNAFVTTPKRGLGWPMSPPCLKSHSCHLILLYYLLSCSSAQFCYPFCACCPFSWLYFQKTLPHFSLRDRLSLWLLFSSWERWVAWWCVQRAAMWHWYLLLCNCIMFLIFYCSVYSVKKNPNFSLTLALMDEWSGPQCQCVLAFMHFFKVEAMPRG